MKALKSVIYRLFDFCEKDIGHWHAPRYRQLAPLWIKNNDGLHRIYYRVEGELGDDGTVCTWRTFLNLDGQPLPLHDIENWRGE